MYYHIKFRTDRTINKGFTIEPYEGSIMVPTSQGSFDGTRGDMNNHVHVNKTIRAVVTALINMLALVRNLRI